MLGGYYHNLTSTSYNYAPFSFRLGKLLSIPCCERWGCFEPIIEVSGAPTFQLGHAYVGTAVILRYNFARADSRVVPYVQVGTGLQYNDAYKDASQNVLGQAMEYTASAQAGFRAFIRPNLSFDIEGGYMVINNLNQAPRNEGIHAIGGSVGFTYYFPCGHH